MGETLGARNALITAITTTSQIASPELTQERKVISIRNSSTGTQEITVSLGVVAVAGVGQVLLPGDTWIDSNSEGYKCYQGTINVISSAAAAQVSIIER